MYIPISNLILLALLYYPLRNLYKLMVNIRAARASKIPYLIAPAFSFDNLWLTVAGLILPVLERLPARLKNPWIKVITPDFAWKEAYGIFQRSRINGGMECDTFLIVSPQTNFLLTADASVITQITTRKADFPKQVEVYAGLEIYGANVVTSEGRDWRRHRRITAPPFGEKNNRIVWQETLFQAGEMVRQWVEGKSVAHVEGAGETEATVAEKKSLGSQIAELSHDTMRLSLYVISRAGFDVRCEWPGRETKEAGDGAMSATKVQEGHALSYVDSLETLLLRMIVLFILPIWSLKYSPFSYLRLARKSFIEWGKYMNEIYNTKTQEILSAKGPDDEGLDLMGAMIKGSGQIPGTPNYNKPDAGLTKDEIIGNSFVLFLAGHETAANSIHFALLYLAMRPEAQRKLQAELDTIFGGREPKDWNYDVDLPKLFAGMAGAVMNEQLRLIPPVVVIPKSTAPGSPQLLNIDGKEYTVPENCAIGLHATGVHRNPKYWPHGPARKSGAFNKNSNTDNDLEEFKPERWLSKDEPDAAIGAASSLVNPSTDGLAVDTSPDTTSSFRPIKGAYIPFSDGARACIGRRFAQVEILATLAVIFSRYSIELSTDAYVEDEEVAKMNGTQRKEVWTKAKDAAEQKLLQEMGTIITIQLRKEGVKVRICERGEEVFDWRDDEL